MRTAYRTAYRSVVCLMLLSGALAAQPAPPAAPPAAGPTQPAAPTPPAPVPPAAPAPADATKPTIDSVFPTTSYPKRQLFDFEINGQHFSPDPVLDDVEVKGEGLIRFKSRYPSTETATPRHAGSEPKACAEENVLNDPCLEVTQDGRRLMIVGYRRHHAYQGPLQVRVWVKQKADATEGAASAYSDPFTLSLVDHRIIVWLAFVVFFLLMYIVYRLVTKGSKGYTVAGQRYSPIAAFLIDKTTDTYSLSKFQLFALSSVAFFGYVYVFLCRALVQWNFTFPDIPDNYPSLLAISVGTTAAATGLTANRGTKGAGPIRPSAADFISNGGLVVADRFQFFVWTLIACLGFVALILMQDPATVNGFPTFPTGLLYVMGVSAGGYLGGKAVAKPGPILKQVTVRAVPDTNVPPGPGDLGVTLAGENLDKNGRFRIDGAEQQLEKDTPLSANGSDAVAQASQGPYSKLVFTLAQAAGFAEGDHVFEIVNSDGIGAQRIFTATPMQASGATAARGAHTVTLTVDHYRDGSSARWLAPGASDPVDIPAADVKREQPGGNTVVVTLSVGDKPGVGTLTLMAPLGGTVAASVTVS
jgi:hypothetical protein